MSAGPAASPIGPLARLLALAIDAAWLLGVSLPWIWWISAPGRLEPAWAWLGVVVLLSLAALPFWLCLGGTPGQLLLGQRLVDDRGAPRLLWRQVLLRWASAWLTLASLLYAPLWRDGGRRTRAWHERMSGTALVERDPERPESVPYRHWVGELPLAESLVHALAWPLPLLLAFGAVQAAAPLGHAALRGGALLLLLGWPLLAAVIVWGAVGAWRAAGRPAARAASMRAATGTPQSRRTAARALVALAAFAGLCLGVLNVLPRVPELVLLVFGHDPLGSAEATVSPDGRRLYVKGPLGLGSAAQVQRRLDDAPQLRWVVLESADGRLPEALRIATALRARGLRTRVSGECSGPCAFAFLSGVRRQLLPGARLGLRRLSAGTFNPPYQGLLNRSFGARLEAAGLTPHLVRKTLATPPSRTWYPEADEQAASHLVTVPERPLDVELPDPQGAVLADYAEALSASVLWQALEQRFPGLQALAAGQMAAASARGADAVQLAAQQAVSARLPPLLARASPETRWLYAEILLAQMQALGDDPASCSALLLGDVAAHRLLPRELAWREAGWLLGALTEAPRAEPVRRPKPLELEVIRRTLGTHAPGHLAGLWRPPSPLPAGAADCARGKAMLAELDTLAAPQRRLALRLMFERE
ncbi:MAG TPA: RDD family protein [Rubrivivax sp.]|nr:RDD family protein [Rubrivivax sp.]